MEKTIRLACVISVLTLISHLSLSPVLAQPVISDYASAPITIDGVETQNEWDNAAKIALENSIIFVKNDDSKLYLLIDVVGDTFEDSLFSPFEDLRDYVNLVFDVNRDKLVTPDIDVSYITYNEENIPLSIAYFIAPGSTSAYSKSNSQLIAAMGSSTNSDQTHRIWEIAIDRQEINAQENPVRMGLKVRSWGPEINDIKPPNYRNDFTNLMEIALESEGNVGGTAMTNDTTSNVTGNATNATTTGGGANETNATIQSGAGNETNVTEPSVTENTANTTPPDEPEIPPITTSEQQPWWTRPEIFVPITVAIIGGVIGPLLVARYGKRHGSKDEAE